MKTNGLRGLIYKAILLILLSLYFLLVFSQPCDQSYNLPYGETIYFKKNTPPSLPKILNFEGTSSNKQVKLKWEFETTDGLDECVLERAERSGNFKPVAYFFMTEDIHIPNLRYTDSVPKNKTYSYRLRLTSKEGDNQYTNPLTFKIGRQNQKELLVYPFTIR